MKVVVALALVLLASSAHGFVVTNRGGGGSYGTKIRSVTTSKETVLVERVCDDRSNANAKTTTTSMRTTTSADVFRHAAMSMAVAFGVFLVAGVNPSFADGQTEKFRLPPIDYADKNRCTLQGSTIGQANAARDKLYDLRQCKLSNSKASGYDLSGVIMTETDVSGSKFVDAYFSKAYLQDSTFDKADFTNAIVDRASFKGSSLRGTIFKNTVLTGTSFENANVEDADFTEAALGSFDLRTLCKNPTLKGTNPITGNDTKESVGCP